MGVEKVREIFDLQTSAIYNQREDSNTLVIKEHIFSDLAQSEICALVTKESL